MNPSCLLVLHIHWCGFLLLSTVNIEGCTNAENAGDLLVPFLAYWTHTTLAECCYENFVSRFRHCMDSSLEKNELPPCSISPELSGLWYYVDDDGDNECVRECMAGTSCKGRASSDKEMYASFDECCSLHLWWIENSPSCIQLPELSGNWYLYDVPVKGIYECVRECAGHSPCNGRAPREFFDMIRLLFFSSFTTHRMDDYYMFSQQKALWYLHWVLWRAYLVEPTVWISLAPYNRFIRLQRHFLGYVWRMGNSGLLSSLWVFPVFIVIYCCTWFLPTLNDSPYQSLHYPCIVNKLTVKKGVGRYCVNDETALDLLVPGTKSDYWADKTLAECCRECETN